MLMPVGLIGAGKTTVVKPLAERLHLLRLSTDEVRRLLGERGYSYEGCRDIIFRLGQKYLGLGYSLALDANTGSTAGLDYNARIIEAYPHVRQIFIYINPPEDYILNKLKTYKHTWLFKDGEQAVNAYLTNKGSFTLPDVHFAYTFDPSRADLPDQIRQGAEALECELSLEH